MNHVMKIICSIVKNKTYKQKEALYIQQIILLAHRQNNTLEFHDWLCVVDELHKRNCLSTENIKLTLMKIKLNDNFIRLGNQFGISTAGASKIFQNSVPKLCHFLKTLIYCPPRESVKMTLFIPFRANFAHVYGIIDCFEIQIEKPSNALQQSLTWSEYKKCNTLKYLICCIPDGFINFISSGYGGRVNDVELFEQCDIMDVLPKKCGIMADRGFKQIQTCLNKIQCELIRPPSVKRGSKSSKTEVMLTKRIASLRIHVERVIRRLREFSLLEPHSTLNHNIMSYPVRNHQLKRRRINDFSTKEIS
ncbi:uncharacterized protein [Polyergus mexicanus]|uniref:uncharacterized protein n=1 Tax=Polyergus mexicanus TaxID=615972 RepID=UPI0038B5809C